MHTCPHWQHEIGINKGYRETNDMWQALASIFSWHNQSVNIWTAIFLTWYNFTKVPKYDFYFRIHSYLRGTCWFFSTIAHTFNSVESVRKMTDRIDFIGVYLGAYGMGANMKRFLPHLGPIIIKYNLIYKVLATLTIVFMMHPKMNTVEYYSTRNLVFITYCFLEFLPSMIEFICFGYCQIIGRFCISLFLLFLAGLPMLIRFPETYFQNKFDLICPSHTLWHIGCFFFDCYFNLACQAQYKENLSK